MSLSQRPLILISSCLLGEKVRYNAGHMKDDWFTTQLSNQVDFLPLCPEVAMGLSIPREEIELYLDDNKNPQMQFKKSKENLTKQAQATYQKLLNSISEKSIAGAILTKKSPSCGIYAVKTRLSQDNPNVTRTAGLFANAFMQAYPHTPAEDSGRMRDLQLRENFVKRVFAQWRWQQLPKTISALQKFHQQYKYILMEHNQEGLRRLGQICAQSNSSIEDTFLNYNSQFQSILSEVPTPERRYNTLEHILGYLKEPLSKTDKAQVLELMQSYKSGQQPYMVPLKMLEFFVKKFEVDYLLDQYYFNPYPEELKIHQLAK